MIDVGLVGTGRWGSIIRATLSRSRDARLVRATSRDWQTVTEATDVDAVLIASPPATHAEIALSALRNGKSVFIEKPMTLSVSDAARVIEAAKQSSVTVWVDHIDLFNPAFVELRARLAEIGVLTRIDAELGTPDPDPRGASLLWDWGPHAVAMALSLLGSPRSVAAVKTLLPGGERISLELGFESAVARLVLSSCFPARRRRLTAVGRDASLVYDDRSSTKLSMREGPGRVTAIPVSDEPPLDLAVRAFFEAVREGSANLEHARLGADVVAVLARAESCLA